MCHQILNVLFQAHAQGVHGRSVGNAHIAVHLHLIGIASLEALIHGIGIREALDGIAEDIAVFPAILVQPLALFSFVQQGTGELVVALLVVIHKHGQAGLIIAGAGIGRGTHGHFVQALTAVGAAQALHLFIPQAGLLLHGAIALADDDAVHIQARRARIAIQLHQRVDGHRLQHQGGIGGGDVIVLVFIRAAGAADADHHIVGQIGRHHVPAVDQQQSTLQHFLAGHDGQGALADRIGGQIHHIPAARSSRWPLHILIRGALLLMLGHGGVIFLGALGVNLEHILLILLGTGRKIIAGI